MSQTLITLFQSEEQPLARLYADLQTCARNDQIKLRPERFVIASRLIAPTAAASPHFTPNSWKIVGPAAKLPSCRQTIKRWFEGSWAYGAYASQISHKKDFIEKRGYCVFVCVCAQRASCCWSGDATVTWFRLSAHHTEESCLMFSELGTNTHKTP